MFHAICKFTQSANCATQSEDLQIGGQSADCACANTCTFCARVWFMDACPGVAASTSRLPSKKRVVRPVSRSLTIEIIESQVQEGCSDCGLFAIANAFSLCNGDGPSTTYWYQDQMRGHLVACLKAEVLTAFPGRHSPTAKEKVLQVMNIPVFCHCRQPEDRTKKMPLCQACQEWYHTVCEDVPRAVFCNKQGFICSSCNNL